MILAFITGWSVNSWRNDYALSSRAHQIAPLNATALNNLATALIVRNDIDGAQKLLESGYRDHPADFHFALNLGYMYYGKGQYQKAEPMLLRVKEIDPRVADADVLLGQIQLRRGHPKEAQVYMRNAVHLNPYLWSLHTIYGVVLAQNGDCPDAEHEFEAALDLNPGEGLTQHQMDRCRAKVSPAVPPATKPGQL
jgi:Flp pilus assembly protein TadD